MPVLTNPRWERLAQELAQNKTATEAMQLAGYSDPRNSTRLTKKDEIRRRVEELQSRGAERAEVSVASLLQELEDARAKASNLDQLSAAVRAIEAKAKVSGLLTQKVEVTNVTQDIPDDASPAEIAAWFARNYDTGGIELTEKQASELAGIFETHITTVHTFLASCHAKPVAGRLANAERKRLGLRQIGNAKGPL